MSFNNNDYLIGARIKAARKKKNITQRKLSNDTEISDTVISLYENAKQVPSLTSLAKIANALDVTIDELYFGNGNERFISESFDEPELIVNGYYELWKHASIDTYQKYTSTELPYPGILLAINYPVEIEDFIRQLNEFKNNEKTYDNPDVYLNQIKKSIANRIRNNQKKK